MLHNGLTEELYNAARTVGRTPCSALERLFVMSQASMRRRIVLISNVMATDTQPVEVVARLPNLTEWQ